MHKKTTKQLLNLISQESCLRRFLTENNEEFEDLTLCSELNRLLRQSGQNKAKIIHLSNLDKSYVYQIFSGRRLNPSRNKLLAICIAIGADLYDTQRILRLGHSEQLHPRVIRDIIIIYAINHKTSVVNLNQVLYDMGMEILS